MADIHLQNPGLIEHPTVITAVRQVDGHLAIGVAENIIRPHGGGQPSDAAVVKFGSRTAPVIQVRKIAGETFILVEMPPNAALRPGDPIELCVDAGYRLSLSQSHSLAHIVMAALRNVVDGFEDEGANIGRDARTVELRFRSREPMTSDLLDQVDILARMLVARPIPIVAEHVACAADAEIRFRQWRNDPESRLNGPLRVIHIHGIDASLCSGTHVGSTQEIGAFSIEELKTYETGICVLAVKRRHDWIRWHRECALAYCYRVQLSSFDL